MEVASFRMLFVVSFRNFERQWRSSWSWRVFFCFVRWDFGCFFTMSSYVFILNSRVQFKQASTLRRNPVSGWSITTLRSRALRGWSSLQMPNDSHHFSLDVHLCISFETMLIPAHVGGSFTTSRMFSFRNLPQRWAELRLLRSMALNLNQDAKIKRTRGLALVVGTN